MKRLIVHLAVWAVALPIAAPANATWPGRNGLLVFSGCRLECEDTGTGADLFVAQSNGSDRHKLTNLSEWETSPQWSPDGSEIVFTCRGSGLLDDPNEEICIVDADGSDLIEVTDNDVQDDYPTWSPDGSQIAFVRGVWPDSELYVMDADGSDSQRLTNDQSRDESPAWSPDGEWIAYVSGDDDQRIDVFRIPAAGGDRENLTSSRRHENTPSWSPDGRKILFSRYHRSRRQEGWQVWKMDADATNQQALTRTRDGFNVTPVFSPNARIIVFNRAGKGRRYNIAKMRPNGRRVRTVISRRGWQFFSPDWQAR